MDKFHNNSYTPFLITLVGAVSIYFGFVSVGIEKEFASGAAGLAFVGLLAMYEQIEKNRSLRLADQPSRMASIATFDEFSIPWLLIVFYAASVLFGAINASSFLAGAMLSLRPSDVPVESSELLTATGLVVSLVGPICAYFIGRWIGCRCRDYGVAAVICSLILGITLVKCVDYGSYYIAFLAMFGLVGYWRGRKRRLASYMQYLLNTLPSDTRETLVNIAFDEVKALKMSIHSKNEANI